MLTKVFSAALRGVDALEVEIELNSGSGDPQIVIVGLSDASGRESSGRHRKGRQVTNPARRGLSHA